jgi:hypothetical protein
MTRRVHVPRGLRHLVAAGPLDSPQPHLMNVSDRLARVQPLPRPLLLRRSRQVTRGPRLWLTRVLDSRGRLAAAAAHRWQQTLAALTPPPATPLDLSEFVFERLLGERGSLPAAMDGLVAPSSGRERIPCFVFEIGNVCFLHRGPRQRQRAVT